MEVEEEDQVIRPRCDGGGDCGVQTLVGLH